VSALAHGKSVPGGLNLADEVLQKIYYINPTRLMPKVKARLQQL
jgi:hypothetical protein